MKFFSIPNTTSIVATPLLEPWNYNKTKIPDDIVASQNKVAYRSWCNNPATSHAFISCYEGMDPNRRISWDEGNHPIKSYGIIVDYDASNALTAELLADIASGKRKWPSEFAPAYVADSFTNGHLRVIWQYEASVLIASDKHNKKLMQILDKKIKFNKWFSGFEAEALGDAAKYYMIGSNYRPIRPDSFIPKNLLDLWSFEAAKQVTDSLVERKFKVPMEAVAKEVEARFPGRWKGPFDVGARGVRFWDPTASDPTGAVVLDQGMLAYSGEQAFLPWVKIFGTSFVERFEADKISGVMDRLVVEDGATSSYWVLDKDRWVRMNQSQVTMHLQCLGFSSSVAKNETASEVTRVLNEVHLQRRVSGAYPYIHYPNGIVTIDNRKVLNISDARALAPAPAGLFTTLSEARQYFPLLWSYISGFFEKTDKDTRSPNIQLEMYLSWLQHAYSMAVKTTPQPGLIMVLVGPPSAGKSFMLHQIISPLLGGAHDIKDILSMNGGKYTDLLTKSPVGYIDDLASSTNTDEHKKYSERIKALVSNHKITFDGKWKATGEVWWFGRIVICMNDDASSVRMMPDMSLSMAGKVSLLMINRNRTDGYRFSGDWKKTEETIKKELPFFARWLLDCWKTPDYLVNHGNPRYGLVPYKHPELYHEAQERGVKHELYELLKEFMDDNLATADANYDGWTGSTTALFGALSVGKFDIVMRKWTTARLGTALGLLASSTNLTRKRMAHNVTVWHIPKDFMYLKQGEFGEKVHSAADEKARLAKLTQEEIEKDGTDEGRPLVIANVESKNTELEALTAALRDSSDTQLAS